MVYPDLPDTYWGFKYSLRFIGKKSGYPPLGLLTVAALMPDGYEIKLIDMNVEKLNDKDIKEADMIFISAMIVQNESMKKVIDRCRVFGKIIVAGGPYPTNSYKSIEGVDHFVLNEAEITLPLFLKDFENGTAEKIYTSDIKPDITKTPVPRFDLVDMRKYSAMILQYSRGCPFTCEFCDIIELFGRVPRTKLPGQFLTELEKIYNTGHRGSVFIVDDNFIGNKSHVKILLKEVIKWQKERRFPFFFYTEASINLSSDEELMDLMVEAGFNMVFVGIETPVEESLVLTKKSQNTKIELLESVRTIQNKGLEVSAGFIIGFDNDPVNIFELQSKFIRESGISMAMVGLLTALPKTQLFKRLEAENRILNESSGNNTFDLQVNFVPKMSPDLMIEGYKKVISEIYTPEEYFKRCRLLINNLPNNYRFGPDTPSVSELARGGMAFIVSLFKQTFSGYGQHYLGFLGYVVLHKIRLFPKAVQLAILGYHFIKMTGLQISSKNEELIRFKYFLERTLDNLHKRIAAVQNLNLKDIFSDLIILRKKILPEVQKRYLQVWKFSNHAVESYFRRLADRSGQYLEKASTILKARIEKFDITGLQNALLALMKYKIEVLSEIQNKYGDLNKNIRDYSKEMIEKIDMILNNLVSEIERLIYQKAKESNWNHA